MTTLLLSEIKEHERQFNIQPHKRIWKEICSTINSIGYNITPDQCCSKWKSLKRKYTQIKDNNNRTGAANQRWIHFEMVDNILKTRPEIEPLSLASSTSGFRIRNIPAESGNSSMDNAENDEFQIEASSNNRRTIGQLQVTSARRRSRVEPYWAEALRKQRERHHRQNVVLLERFLSFCGQLLQK